MIRRSGAAGADRPLSVDEVALRVRNLIDYDAVLARVAVEGELTDFKRHVSGHIYFSMKGQNASLSCVMFRSDAAGQLLWPSVGVRVCAVGSVRYYDARGTVQVYARKLFPLGEGAAARAKEELRRRLESEGLFSPARKRPIPRYPRVVACVTSDTGAAVRDVMRQYRARFPLCELVVVPCLVQGVRAAESAALALRRAQTISGVEVILLVRGGGAKEDLNPFDDEELVREVARSSVPVVTGIGHEIDESLCDMAADRREPTPTAAAAFVFPDRAQERQAVSLCERRLAAAAQNEIGKAGSALSAACGSLAKIARFALQSAAQRLDALEERLSRRMADSTRLAASKLDELERSLGNLSPRALARRGYGLVLKDGRALCSAASVNSGEQVVVQFPDGDLYSTVDEVASRA
ncbi:MAG: exodeoxyribonuclease VII large subunit [Pyramidobacter sp.]|nr:exodeoxyribonuclease VII large subunit [Pyramidobacter sp.]